MHYQLLTETHSWHLRDLEDSSSQLNNKQFIDLIEKCGFGCPSSLSGRQKRENYIAKVALSLHNVSRRPFRYVVSVDIGRKNLAYIIYDSIHDSIIRWRLFSIDGSHADLPELSRSVRRTFREMTENLPLEEVMFVIEKQLRCGFTLISAQFHVLAEASEEITPAVMAAFKNGHGADSAVREYKHRKKAAVKMAKDWLNGDLDSLPLILFDTFEESLNFRQCKKKDDMADCLLQLLAYLQFTDKRYEYVLELLK